MNINEIDIWKHEEAKPVSKRKIIFKISHEGGYCSVIADNEKEAIEKYKTSKYLKNKVKESREYEIMLRKASGVDQLRLWGMEASKALSTLSDPMTIDHYKRMEEKMIKKGKDIKVEKAIRVRVYNLKTLEYEDTCETKENLDKKFYIRKGKYNFIVGTNTDRCRVGKNLYSKDMLDTFGTIYDYIYTDEYLPPSSQVIRED